MSGFKDEMSEFKDEMKEFKDEMRESRKAMDKKWGDLANKMGTVVEDLISPNVKNAILTAFNREVSFIATHIKKYMKVNKIRMEIDVLAIADDHVYLFETKTTPSQEKIDIFEQKIKSGNFLKIFPEYKNYQIVQVFASVNIPEHLRNYLHDKEMYPMVMKGSIMEIVTAPSTI